MDTPDFAVLPDGGRLGYTVRGDGPPLLLLRPVGGSMLSWSRFGEELSRRALVIAFDPRGTGCSSDAPLPTTTRGMARDALSLLEHLGVPRAHVYGISMGGMVASFLAVDAPARVDRLILASTLPRGTAIRTGALLRGLSIARCLAQPAREAEACLVKRILSPQFRARHPDEVRRIQELARARPASHLGLLKLLAAAAAHDVSARLPEITAETLVIVGEHDPLITLASQKELLRRLPHATFDVITGAGHDLSTEAPHRAAARVLAHIGAD
jgi:3-oxoadipate enol-lactonase